ncbi:MAG: cell division inhibitor [Bacteroidetes bacterium]|jgi:ligand-binding SRPBCC domain-containing protein|nr:cell division inhibitor [Bacteroidota bacterium]
MKDIYFNKHSGIYTLTAKQWLPAGRDKLWDFIAHPRNLSKITPPHMKFIITSELDSEVMYTGQIISYHVYPIKGFKTNWVTEIKHVKEGAYFVDEQLFGPYKLWHHKHFLEDREGGTQMTDIVSYKLPFGRPGSIAQTLFVKNQLIQIFTFRKHKLEELFGQDS